MRVAERFAGRELPRSLAFVAFGAEEIGLVGSQPLRRRGEVDAARLDASSAWSTSTASATASSLELLCSPARRCSSGRGRPAEQLGLHERYDVVTELAQDAGTDHLPFAEAGIPALSILHFPYDEYHCPRTRSTSSTSS